MPNIVQYTAKGEITPSDEGIRAAELAGRRMGQFGNEIKGSIDQLGQVVEDHMAVMETSELYKTGTELRIGLQQRYDKESADPANRNDPNFGERFMTEVGPTLDQWGSGAQTKRGAALAAVLKSSIRNDIFNHVSAGQSEMDAAHQHDNLKSGLGLIRAGLSANPTPQEYAKAQGQSDDMIASATAAIPDVGKREESFTSFKDEQDRGLADSLWTGRVLAAADQIELTGDISKSPAYAQVVKDLDSASDPDKAAALGLQYVDPDRIRAKLDSAAKDAVNNYHVQQERAHQEKTWSSQDTAAQAMAASLNGQPWSNRRIAAAGLRAPDASAIFEFNRKVAEPDPQAEEGYFKKGYEMVVAAAAAGKPVDMSALVAHMGGAGQPGYSESQFRVLVDLNKDLTGKTMTANDKVIQKAAIDGIKAELHSAAWNMGAGKADPAGDAAFESAIAHYLPLAAAARANGVPTVNIWDRTGKAPGSIFAASPWNAATYKGVGSQVTAKQPAPGVRKGPPSMDDLRAIAGLH